MQVDIEKLFSPGGALSEVDPEYEHRAEQTQMALAVARCLEQEGRLVVEAGTGVGKSLGYLLPGALWAMARGARLMVSTHTRALQEQLMSKELPMAARALSRLGLSLDYAMLMGADNYVCAQRLAQVRRAPELFGDCDARVVEEIAAWAETAGTGHRSRLPRLVPQGTWSRISRDTNACLGPAGPSWSRCLYRKDRERAERSRILVVNHALLLSGARLPDYDALIVDEAHNLAEAAISRFGLSVSQNRYVRLLQEISSQDGRHGLAARLSRAEEGAVDGLRRSVKECAEGAEKFFGEIAAAHGLAAPARKRRAAADETEAKRFIPGDYGGAEALKGLEQSLAALVDGAASPEEAAELKMLELRVVALRADIRTFLEGGKEDVAHWVERRQGRLELCAAPLAVSEQLSNSLLSRGIPVVMASATLSSGAGLKDFKAQVGLEGAEELALNSPFDFESQAALLVMDHLPPPQEEEASLAAVAAHCREIIAAVPGGVLILFSSWKALRRVHEALRGAVAGRPLWIQGETGSDALLSDFMEAGNAILMGVDTFWQGVDVPGSALSCVVMVKLPFANFTSPIEEARRQFYEAREKNYFESYSLPRAVMKFRQGFGRLIRSASDRGAVVVLDSRLLHKGYGQAFLDALPRCKRLESLEDLREFFKVPADAVPPQAFQPKK